MRRKKGFKEKMNKMIRIGTRESQLALLQTQIVVSKIKQIFPEIEIKIVPMTTKGDQHLDRSFASFGGKGVFTKELETALLDETIDLAVHSAKDLPLLLPTGLTIGAVLEREDPADVFVTMDGKTIEKMSESHIIGTGSLRRELQIRKKNKHVQIKNLRGNVQTRLHKLKEGQYHGIVLAAAGLKRLNILPYPDSEYYMERLLSEEFLPAAGQGILAVECREADLVKNHFIAQVLKAIHVEETKEILLAERRFLEQIDGGCNAPAAAWCRKEGKTLKMSGMYAGDGIHMKNCVIYGQMGQGEELGHQMAKKLCVGKVYLVGAGPATNDLLTIRAQELLKEADVIVYDNLISAGILQNTRPESKWIYAGKRASSHHLPQKETNQILIKEAKQGKMVVRLKGGDPFVFGRGAEEAAELIKEGIPFEIVSGVSSCYSVPAYAGIPVTDRTSASSFHVITGHEQVGGTRIQYEVLAKEEGTLVFMMGVHQVEEICRKLIENGKSAKTPAALIANGTTRRQKVILADLQTLPEEVYRNSMPTPAVIVIGEVAKWSKSLSWFQGNQYFKKRVLLTGTEMWVRLGERKLKELGADPVPFSLIRAEFSGKTLLEKLLKTEEYKTYQWFVFTSRNGVKFFFEMMRSHQVDIRTLSGIQFAVIGKGTAETLQEYGITADFIPQIFNSEAMAKEWIPMLKVSDRVLLMRAKEGSNVLPRALTEAKIFYQDLPLYQIITEDKKAEELRRILPDMDYVVLASGSAAKAFAKMTMDQEKMNYKILEKLKILSIGLETTKAARKEGLFVERTAREYSIEGILDLIREENGELEFL